MLSEEESWQPWQPTAQQPWDLKRVVHVHRRAGFAATWKEIQRDLKDGPQTTVDRLLAGKSRLEGVPSDFDQMADVYFTRSGLIHFRRFENCVSTALRALADGLSRGGRGSR